MSNHPTISVIIPAYNAAEFVGRAIESALNQTYPALEILVIDDGSGDNTAERVLQIADCGLRIADCGSAEDPSAGPKSAIRNPQSKVRLLRQQNGGPAAARNHGARIASGEWLALLDADDAWLPHKLETQLPYLADRSVAAVHARQPAEYAPVEGTFEALWRRNFLFTSSVLLRRSAFEEVGGFNEDRALIGLEDYNLWLRLAARGYRIVGHPELLHEYTPAPGHLSGQWERFARAELANVEAIGHCLSLDPVMVQEKQTAIYEEYGRVLFYYRKLGPARRFLGTPLMRRPSLARLAWWLATFIPPTVLNWRRRFAEQV
jgi:glycosyltransferase involved in cell wall biosynthesis